jgi:uridine kinase
MRAEISPIWIGIQGGTCAGKTTLAHAVAQHIGLTEVLIIGLDLFYHPFNKHSPLNSAAINFDAPSSINWQLIQQVVRRLKSGRSTAINVYDGVSISQRLRLVPRKYIIIEGLWAFNKGLSNIFDLRVYVDTSPDIRLLRRINRDVLTTQEWTIREMLSYYMKCIRPMHAEFVETGKMVSHVIVNGEDDIDYEVNQVLEKLGPDLLGPSLEDSA